MEDLKNRGLAEEALVANKAETRFKAFSIALQQSASDVAKKASLGDAAATQLIDSMRALAVSMPVEKAMPKAERILMDALTNMPDTAFVEAQKALWREALAE